MSDHLADPTPYPDLNALLRVLLSDVRAILRHQFVGMYLSGSLAGGDFDVERSDIDWLIVTADELPAETIVALEAMHARITAGGLRWAARLEGSYVPQRALWRYDPSRATHPSLAVGGKFGMDGQGSDGIIQRHILREQGVVVAGPALQTLIEPVSPGDLQQAQRATLDEWWRPQLADPFRLRSREYQAYAVLTMCRALYMLQHARVVSKPVAARWAQRVLGQPWAALIERALLWRHDDRVDDVSETLKLIQYTLEQGELAARCGGKDG